MKELSIKCVMDDARAMVSFNGVAGAAFELGADQDVVLTPQDDVRCELLYLDNEGVGRTVLLGLYAGERYKCEVAALCIASQPTDSLRVIASTSAVCENPQYEVRCDLTSAARNAMTETFEFGEQSAGSDAQVEEPVEGDVVEAPAPTEVLPSTDCNFEEEEQASA